MTWPGEVSGGKASRDTSGRVLEPWFSPPPTQPFLPQVGVSVPSPHAGAQTQRTKQPHVPNPPPPVERLPLRLEGLDFFVPPPATSAESFLPVSALFGSGDDHSTGTGGAGLPVGGATTSCSSSGGGGASMSGWGDSHSVHSEGAIGVAWAADGPPAASSLLFSDLASCGAGSSSGVVVHSETKASAYVSLVTPSRPMPPQTHALLQLQPEQRPLPELQPPPPPLPPPPLSPPIQPVQVQQLIPAVSPPPTTPAAPRTAAGTKAATVAVPWWLAPGPDDSAW